MNVSTVVWIRGCAMVGTPVCTIVWTSVWTRVNQGLTKCPSHCPQWQLCLQTAFRAAYNRYHSPLIMNPLLVAAWRIMWSSSWGLRTPNAGKPDSGLFPAFACMAGGRMNPLLVASHPAEAGERPMPGNRILVLSCLSCIAGGHMNPLLVASQFRLHKWRGAKHSSPKHDMKCEGVKPNEMVNMMVRNARGGFR